MLDCLPCHSPGDAGPRLLGIRFLKARKASLVHVAAATGDEEAAALVYALTDMIIDLTVDPMHWPIEETIALLRRPDAAQNGDAELLAGELTHLRNTIDIGSM